MTEMREVGVVTDSTADVPPELVKDLDITVVPLSVTVGGHTFLDGEMPMAEFFRRMAASPVLPTTSQPPVGAFVEAFRRALERYREVVCIDISGKLSGTLESAREAARIVGERIHVVDSRSLSFGEGVQVILAARAAAAGGTLDEVLRVVERARERVRLIVGLDSLENLAKGGRIGKVSALLGGMLNLKVLLTVNAEGSFEPVAKVRGASAAMQTALDWLGERVDATKQAVFAVLHSESPERALWLAEQVRARFSVSELHIIETGPVIGAHTGTGWGLAALPID